MIKGLEYVCVPFCLTALDSPKFLPLLSLNVLLLERPCLAKDLFLFSW